MAYFCKQKFMGSGLTVKRIHLKKDLFITTKHPHLPPL